MSSPATSVEKTLLDWAANKCPNSPRTRVKEWIKEGRFCLKGRVVTKAGMRLADPGDMLSFGKPEQGIPA